MPGARRSKFAPFAYLARSAACDIHSKYLTRPQQSCGRKLTCYSVLSLTKLHSAPSPHGGATND